MTRQRQSVRRGISATELAITLPLLIALCVTTVDVGRFAHTHIALHHAARIGADLGATRFYTAYADDEWRQTIMDAATAEMEWVTGFDAGGFQVDVQVEPLDEVVHRVVVSCQYDFPLIMPWPGMANPLPMRSSVAMRRDR